jgi:hypothetical protein
MYDEEEPVHWTRINRNFAGSRQGYDGWCLPQLISSAAFYRWKGEDGREVSVAKRLYPSRRRADTAMRLPASRAGGNAPTVYRRLRVPMRREGVENEAKEAPSREDRLQVHRRGGALARGRRWPSRRSKQPAASIVEHLPDAFPNGRLPCRTMEMADETWNETWNETWDENWAQRLVERNLAGRLHRCEQFASIRIMGSACSKPFQVRNNAFFDQALQRLIEL